MRRIVSKKKEVKRQKKNQIIIGTILILIMFSSVLGFGFGTGSSNNSGSSEITYNGLEFINQNNLWYLTINEVNFIFRYNPLQVQKISSQVNDFNSYYQEPLYIQSENSEAELEIYLNLGQIALRTQKACYENCVEENSDLPIKTCEDNFIIIQESENMEILQQDNCVFIKGPSEDLIKITDEFLFKILRIENI
jgi:hypothetical protein